MERRFRLHVREARHTLVPAREDPDGPLAPLLLVLTVVTGLVDAFSYLDLGHVFVANMTGNVVFLAFALVGANGFSIVASLVALGAFGVGSLLGGRLVVVARGRGRMLMVAASVESVLMIAAVGLSATSGSTAVGGHRYGLIAMLAVAMGVQNSTARKLAVPDLTTTVLTLTTTAMFADSRAVGGPGSKVGRRMLSILAMFCGALVGAAFVLHGQTTVVLVVGLILLALVAAVTGTLARDQPGWAQA
ncbi:MAG: YoaK family protein [Acidimicrobiales bacterium]